MSEVESGAGLKAHYDQLYRLHGASHQAVQWSSRETQERRFDVLCDVIGPNDSVLDVGSGLGDLLGYLRQRKGFTGRYLGLDFVPGFVAHGREVYAGDSGARFEELDVRSQRLPSDYDVVVTSGIFNNAVADNWGFLTSTVASMFSAARRRVAFNALSTYVDYRDSGLFYCDPLQLFDHLKRQLTPLVTLRHDYLVKPNGVPFEFAMYLSK
jgi:SAM-dependent methyltransferase